MVDFGSAAHGDYFSITDTYDPLSNRRAFYDTSYVLPAGHAREPTWRTGPHRRLENFLYMLRSGMMGWLTIMLDTTAWTPEQHAAAKKEIALYKTQLRPLIRDADLYHISDASRRRALGRHGVLRSPNPPLAPSMPSMDPASPKATTNFFCKAFCPRHATAFNFTITPPTIKPSPGANS